MKVGGLFLAVLASGSSGNCCYLETSAGALLVDAGLSARETLRRLKELGRDPARVEAILVTHEHIDHARGVRVLARQLGVPVRGTAGTLDALPEEVPGARELPSGESERMGGFTVSPFSLPHDAADPVGFVLEAGGVRVGVATDLGCVTGLARERLAGCGALVLESNHDERMLMEGPYPWHLKQRIRSRRGHLSNGDAAEMLAGLWHRRLRAVVLAHLSETNNLPRLALEGARAAMGGDLFLAAAEAARPLTLDLAP